MLSISAMTGGQERYYTDLAREDYYLEGGEPLGRWFGKGAEKLGLSSQVEREQLSALFRGYAPDDRKLVLNAGKADRQPGWDLTFSAPKSVSTLWSQAPEPLRQAIQEAHYESVRAALGYLEDAAGVTRRGHGGTEVEQAGLVIALFEHGTSRAQEPQLHIHTLVQNAAIRDDGTWGAIRSHDLYEHKMTVGALYRAGFAYRLSHDLGLRIKPEKTWFEVEGVPRTLMDEFSTRRAQIEDALAASGLHGAKAAELATLSTRKVKQHVARDELFSNWREAGDENGFSVRQAEKLLQREAAKSRDPSELAHESVAALTQSRSFFFERDVVRWMAVAAQDGTVSARDITSAARNMLASEKTLRFEDREKPGRMCFTTRELYETEREVLDMAERSRGDSRHILTQNTLQAVVDKPRFATLSEEQRKAVEHLTLREGSIQCVSGMAGTGKTHMLAAARQAWAAQGLKVVGCALAATAARELGDGSGIKSGTIRSTLRRLGNTLAEQMKHNLSIKGVREQVTLAGLGHPSKRCIHNKPLIDKKGAIIRRGMKLDSKTVLVVDEVGMVGTRDLAALMKHTEKAGAKLVLVGDEKQLPSIEAGAPYRSLVSRLDGVRLEDIQRQKQPWMRDAVKLFAEGDARGALSLYAKEERLHITETKDEAPARLVRDWMYGRTEKLADTLILAGTKGETKKLNELAQAARRDNGETGFRFAKVAGQKLFEGDRVLFEENRAALGVANGDFGSIEHIAVGVIPGSSTITVRLDRTERKGLFDRSARATFKVSEYDHLALGYAVTTHKAQGATVDQTFVLAETIMQDRELSYVQMSRAREDAHIYVSQADAGEDNCELVRQMERSRPQEIAHDRELREHERSLERSIK